MYQFCTVIPPVQLEKKNYEDNAIGVQCLYSASFINTTHYLLIEYEVQKHVFPSISTQESIQSEKNSHETVTTHDRYLIKYAITLENVFIGIWINMP